MNKPLIFAAAAAALSMYGVAPALDTLSGPYSMKISGLGALIGTAHFAALGHAGEYCRYLMVWESPFNPNEAALCDVRERRTLLYPSCIDNRRQDFITFVHAGPASVVGTSCSGFDNLGEALDDMSLLLGESAHLLQGTVILPWGLTYPIEISRREIRRPTVRDPGLGGSPRSRRAAAGGRFSGSAGEATRGRRSPLTLHP